MALRKCKECGHSVSSKAKTCPSCGAPVKVETSAAAGCLSLLIIGAVIAWCAGVFSTDLGSSSSPAPSATSKPAPREETRQERLEKQFSAWDGSHRALEKLVKESMNDPDSYDHVETTYADMGDHLLVRTEFRGKNKFGGVVKNWVSAKVDLEGNVLQVIAQGP